MDFPSAAPLAARGGGLSLELWICLFLLSVLSVSASDILTLQYGDRARLGQVCRLHQLTPCRRKTFRCLCSRAWL